MGCDGENDIVIDRSVERGVGQTIVQSVCVVSITSSPSSLPSASHSAPEERKKSSLSLRERAGVRV